AEIPPGRARPTEAVLRREQWGPFVNLLRRFVIAEESRTCSSVSSIQTQKDQDFVAAHMIVHVSPIGGPDGGHAVPFAIIRRRHPRGLGVIRSRKCKFLPAVRQKVMKVTG